MGESETSVIESEELQEWENGQDILLSQSEQSFSVLDSSVEQSSPDSSVSYLESTYDMGAFQGYSIPAFGQLYCAGIGCGFALGVCVALASWALSVAITIFKKGGQ